MVIPSSDDAYGLIGIYFKVVMLLLAGFVFANFFFPDHYHFFLPITWLENIYFKDVGAGIMIISFFWIFLAQKQMRDSWRIGIDEETKTDLVNTGLFRYSRNPIFLGMILALAGLFMIAPNAVTLIIFLLGYVLIQIQVRLEEEFLERMHGDVYLDYRKAVRRWI